ncbi:MAG: hypothetical protein ACYCOO_09985 [Chitinophagaceae bacterium]
MRRIILGFLLTILTLMIYSCHQCSPDADCFNALKTIGTLRYARGWVSKLSRPNLYILLVPGKSGMRAFLPCNMPQKYQVDHLQVTVSGWIKSSLKEGVSYPYHPQPLVITVIEPTFNFLRIQMDSTLNH